MPIQIGGISSGLDTASLVQQLMQVERLPLQQMSRKSQLLGFKKELYSGINASLSALQSKVDSLLKSATYKPLKSSSSNEDVASITLGEDAIAGTYSLDVTQLATTTSVVSNVLNSTADTKAQIIGTSDVSTLATIDTTKTFAESGFNVAIPDSDTVTINGGTFSFAKSQTIDDFINSVNGSNAGVIMNYDSINDRFTLESKEAGSNEKIIIDDNNGFFAALGITTGTYTGDGTVDLEATLQNSKIDGLASTGGVFYFKINNHAFNFNETTHSVNDIIETINNSDAGVVAFYDENTDKITLANKDTGSTSIQFEEIYGNFLSTTGLSTNVQTLGKNAEFKLNGTLLTRTDNNVEVNGISISLKTTGSTTVSVEKDVDAIFNSIKGFVDQYNSTVNLLNTRLSEEKVAQPVSELDYTKGMLRGDSTTFNIRSTLRETATHLVSGLSNLYVSLHDIGITTSSADYGKSGTLVIDETKLKDAIKTNPDAVQKLFVNDTDGDDAYDSGEIGVAAKFSEQIKLYISTTTQSFNGTSSKEGILAARIDSLGTEISRYDDQIADYEERLEMVEARYWSQFRAMEQALSHLNNQSSWLNAQLGSM